MNNNIKISALQKGSCTSPQNINLVFGECFKNSLEVLESIFKIFK